MQNTTADAGGSLYLKHKYTHNPNGGPFLTQQNWNKIIYILFVLVTKLQVSGKYNKEPSTVHLWLSEWICENAHLDHVDLCVMHHLLLAGHIGKLHAAHALYTIVTCQY
jgi:hypothetical protein